MLLFTRFLIEILFFYQEQIGDCFCVGTPKSSNLLWGGVISTVP